MLVTFWARAILPTATLNLHHLCMAMVCAEKPLGHMAVPRMERKHAREAEGAPLNINKNTKMQIISRFYRELTGNSLFKSIAK